nr:hypothetical protein [Pelagicoccus albus]
MEKKVPALPIGKQSKRTFTDGERKKGEPTESVVAPIYFDTPYFKSVSKG